MESFITFIKNHVSLSLEAEQVLKQLIRTEKVEKGHIILEEGKTCQRLYFLEEGTVRTYFYQKGKDVTYWIYREHFMFTAWHSYISKEPSLEYMETTEDATLLSISHDDWQDLYTKFSELDRFGRLILEEQMALIDKFYKGYYFLTAKEKYNLLLETYPDIIQRANLGHIASMLGISQETLSRIRGK